MRANILANKNKFKVCIFEAKWPRLSTHTDCWDSIQKSSGQSHFHDQILRQSMVANKFAIWEMFYCEFEFTKQPSFMPNTGSACVWHSDARAASIARANPNLPWTDAELQTLLSNHRHSIAEVVRDVCMCIKGEPFVGSDYAQAFLDYGAPQQILLIQYSGQSHNDSQ